MCIELKCHICDKIKSNPKNKYCSYRCRNIYINSRKDYTKQSKKTGNSLRLANIEKLGEYKDFKINCCKCNNEITVNERSKLFPKKDKYFCSRSCANKRGPRSEDFKRKVRSKLSKPIPIRKCELCEFEFQTRKKHQIFCSRKCSARIKRIKAPIRDLYVNLSQFRFALKSYPNEFNFKLIEEYGWYSAKNRGNNQNGISRDHLFSIKEGFYKMINPLILAHPANCELKTQRINASKGAKSSLELNDLLNNIENWNSKYNENFKVDDVFVTEDYLKHIFIKVL